MTRPDPNQPTSEGKVRSYRPPVCDPVGAARREVEVALEQLQADFDGKGSGPSGLRAEAMAHLKNALMALSHD